MEPQSLIAHENNAHNIIDPAPQPRLCVDLDGTLIKTNALHESILALVRTAPRYVLLLPLWLMRGQAYLWRRLSRIVSLNVELLPYRSESLEYLEREKSCMPHIGRYLFIAKVITATAR
jgi:hypothetical protein